jgi:hypothetical protein
MPRRARIEYVNGTPSQRLAAAIAAVSDGLRQALEYWHEHYLPLHFTVEGGKKYGYQPRSGEGEPQWIYSNRGRGLAVNRGGIARRLIRNPKYYWRKKREGFGVTPLVRTGESAREARAGIRLSTRKTAADGIVQATGAMTVPKYFYQRLKAGTYTRQGFGGASEFTVAHDTPDKYKELTTTTSDEQQVLREIVGRVAMGRLIAAAPPRTVNV